MPVFDINHISVSCWYL